MPSRWPSHQLFASRARASPPCKRPERSAPPAWARRCGHAWPPSGSACGRGRRSLEFFSWCTGYLLLHPRCVPCTSCRQSATLSSQHPATTSRGACAGGARRALGTILRRLRRSAQRTPPRPVATPRMPIPPPRPRRRPPHPQSASLHIRPLATSGRPRGPRPRRQRRPPRRDTVLPGGRQCTPQSGPWPRPGSPRRATRARPWPPSKPCPAEGSRVPTRPSSNRLLQKGRLRGC
mmetsp:Transcript_56080/g.181916  ORF Transcript_56080/g.181916 Transcript_56080/m.181916 type:complete len:235 (-) Transcript_56080:1725-2429(-)